jgi:hypothetical protein
MQFDSLGNSLALNGAVQNEQSVKNIVIYSTFTVEAIAAKIARWLERLSQGAETLTMRFNS